MKHSRRLVTALAALSLTLTLAACSAQSDAQSYAPSGGLSGAPSDVQLRNLDSAQLDASGQPGTLASPEGATADIAPDLAGQSIIKSGSIEIEVDSTPQAVSGVAAVAADFDGTVVSQQQWSSGGSTAFGSVLITVPADKFDAAFIELGKLGTVHSEQRSSDDVTTQHVDLAARVKALETSVTRLSTLMAEASSMTDLLEIEGMLSARQAELDSLNAQLKSLEGQISESSISVSLSEQSVLPGGGPKSFWEALSTGIASIGAFASSAVIVFGVLLPWLIIAAIIAAAIVLPLRARRRKRLARSLQTSPQAAAEPSTNTNTNSTTNPAADSAANSAATTESVAEPPNN